MKNLVVTEEIWKEGTMYTAYCPELDFVSCGRSVEEARNNLVEVIEIQLEEMARLGTLKTFWKTQVTIWIPRNRPFNLITGSCL